MSKSKRNDRSMAATAPLCVSIRNRRERTARHPEAAAERKAQKQRALLLRLLKIRG